MTLKRGQARTGILALELQLTDEARELVEQGEHCCVLMAMGRLCQNRRETLPQRCQRNVPSVGDVAPGLRQRGACLLYTSPSPRDS